MSSRFNDLGVFHKIGLVQEDIIKSSKTTEASNEKLRFEVHRMMSQLQDAVTERLEQSREFNTENEIRLKLLSDVIGDVSFLRRRKLPRRPNSTKYTIVMMQKTGLSTYE